jgi:foldase protein PrsA
VAVPRRTVLALCAFFVLALLGAACGGVPGNAVVRVDDEVITKKTFDHWMNVAARSSQPPGSTQAVSVPDAPNFTRCIAEKKRTAPAPARGQPRPTDDQFKQQCKQEYDGLKEQVLQFLISAAWIQGEARDLGVKVSDKEVRQEFDKQKRESFPQEREYQAFLKSSGMTQKDILLRVKLDRLSNKIREKITKGKSKVSERQIQQYYDKNKQRFSQPERRDLSVVLTRTQAQANQAMAALRGGQPFAQVAKRFSIDEASKAQNGSLPGVSRGQQERALDDAVFGARPNQLVGPVKTQFGFYVFRVNKVTPASQQSLDRSKQTIRQLLQSQNQQQALDKFVKKFQKKWKDRTDCRKGFVVETCKNAPKRQQQTGPGGQQVPQGAEGQQVPQGAQGGAPQGAAPQGAAPQGAAPQGGAPQGGAPQQAPQQQP